MKDEPPAPPGTWRTKKVKRVAVNRVRAPDLTPSNFTQLPLETMSTNPVDPGTHATHAVEGFDPVGEFDTADPEQLINYVLDYVSYAANLVISAPIDAMHHGNSTAARWIGAVFSGGTARPADLARVETHFKYFIATIISCFAFYNWYFLMFFTEGVDKERIKVLDVSTGGINQISQVLGFALKYLVCHVSFVQAALLRVYPQYMKMVFGTKVNMMLLFFLVVAVVYRIGDELFHLLKIYTSEIAGGGDTFNPGSRDYDYTRGIIIVYMLFFGLYSVFGESTMPILQLISLGFKTYTAVATFFLFLLRVLFSSFFTWVAGMFVVAYLLIYSFAAILIYSKSGLVDTIKQINQYINAGDGPEPFSPFSKYSDCNERSWLTWLLEMIRNVVVGIYRYMFELVFMYMFLQALLDYAHNIESVPLKTCLICLCSIFIFILGFVIYTRIRLRALKGDPTVDPVDPIFKKMNEDLHRELDAETEAVETAANDEIREVGEAMTTLPTLAVSQGSAALDPVQTAKNLMNSGQNAVQNVQNLVASGKQTVQTVKNMADGAKQVMGKLQAAQNFAKNIPGMSTALRAASTLGTVGTTALKTVVPGAAPALAAASAAGKVARTAFKGAQIVGKGF